MFLIHARLQDFAGALHYSSCESVLVIVFALRHSRKIEAVTGSTEKCSPFDIVSIHGLRDYTVLLNTGKMVGGEAQSKAE